MVNDKKPEGFDSAESTAEEFAKDKEKAGYLLAAAVEKAERHKRLLKSIWTDLQALLRLLRAWVRGEYRSVPWQTLIFAMAAVVYFVNPFDVVPDFIPNLGFLDDATVVGFVIKSIKNDIDEFVEWEESNT